MPPGAPRLARQHRACVARRRTGGKARRLARLADPRGAGGAVAVARVERSFQALDAIEEELQALLPA
ncbi:hypothetical protein P4200_03450 [Pseudomonas aeruginosa]|nr:hypothetical protein [Pseudomonas aeruginosa]